MRKMLLIGVFLFFVALTEFADALSVNIIAPENNSTIPTSYVWLNVTTNENAVCIYGISFHGNGHGGAMYPKNMSQTGGTSHLQLLDELENTKEEEYYQVGVNCTNMNGGAINSSIFYVQIEGADLKLVNIILLPKKPSFGDSLKINATIKNIGSVPTTYGARLMVKDPRGTTFGEVMTYDPQRIIAPGETRMVDFRPFNLSFIGAYKISVTAISEEPDNNLNNNVLEKIIYVFRKIVLSTASTD